MTNIYSIKNKYVRRAVTIAWSVPLYILVSIVLPMGLVCTELNRAWANFSVYPVLKREFAEANSAFKSCWEGKQ